MIFTSHKGESAGVYYFTCYGMRFGIFIYILTSQLHTVNYSRLTMGAMDLLFVRFMIFNIGFVVFFIRIAEFYYLCT